MNRNFFCSIKNNNEPTIVKRLKLSGELQGELTTLFNAQKSDFYNDDTVIVPFDGQYSPDSDELLAIGGFELPACMGEALQNPMSCETLESSYAETAKIKSIFGALKHKETGKPEILFQVFENNRTIKPNLLNIVFNDNSTFTKFDQHGFTLDSKLTAYYKDEQLHFRSYHFTKRIFDLSQYYREATNEEVRSFVENKNLSWSGDKERLIQMADHNVRRVIARISRNKVLDKFTSDDIVRKADEAGVDITIERDREGKIIIPGEKIQFKILLRFLDDQVYTGPISGETMMSNSSKAVKKNAA